MKERVFVTCIYLWCFTIPAFAAAQITSENDNNSSMFSLAIKPSTKKKVTTKVEKLAPTTFNLFLNNVSFQRVRPQEDSWFNDLFHDKDTSESSLYTMNLTPNISGINSASITFFPIAFKKVESTNPFAPAQPMLTLFTINFF